MTPNARRAPDAAPARTSASAKQFASFSSTTSSPSARARSSRSGRPFRQTVFEFLSVPSRADPDPTAPRRDGQELAHERRHPADDVLVAALALGRSAPPRELGAVGREHDRLDLRAAEIDADAMASRAHHGGADHLSASWRFAALQGRGTKLSVAVADDVAFHESRKAMAR
jgi:hypothetical protein